uniref:RNA-directed DNA polymerase n=1 Tax=Strongyloides venezuelensis TaxID=75913 RepID=A0A0K0F1N3_STRVS
MQKLSNFKISQDKLVTTLDGKIVIPKSTVSHLCRLLHKSHEGYAIMVDRIQRKFSCVGFTTIVKSFLSNCSTCYKNKELRIPKTNRKIKYSLMQKAYVDIGYSEAYSSFFITLVEAYSNYTFASWISNMRAITVIKFLDQIIQLTGTFDMIQFDNQSNFRSKELTNYLCLKGIEPQFSIPFEHYTNGKAERMVKTLKYDLQKMYDDSISKTKAIQKVLEKSRQTPYGKDNEKYTPLQRFFQDKNRELSNTISPIESTTIIPLFLHGYYRPRPDINADWEPCYVLQKINNTVYVIMEPGRHITRRTSRYVKLTSQPLSDEIVAEAKSKLEGCNI